MPVFCLGKFPRWTARNASARLVWPFLLAALLLTAAPATSAGVEAQPEPSPDSLASGGRFAHLDTVDGLSESTVLAMAQDDRGFLWFGTQNGLNRYDGYTFWEVGGDLGGNALPRKNVRALLADGEQIWIGTWGGGVARLDLPTGQITAFTAGEPAGGDFVYALHRDSRGVLWAGTRAGLRRLEGTGAAARFVDYPLAARGPITSIAEDGRGTLWLGGEAGLIRLDPESGQAAGDDFVNALWFDRARGQLWVGARSGLYRLDAASGQSVHFAHDSARPESMAAGQVTSLMSDQPDRLWIGSDGGLSVADMRGATPAFRTFTHNPDDPASLAAGTVVSLLADYSGGIWAGAWTGGLSVYHPARFKFAAPQPTSGLPVSFALDADGGLWVGTFGEGLLRLDGHLAEVDAYRHTPGDPATLPQDAVMAQAVGRDGAHWLGTLGGLSRRQDDGTFTTYDLPDNRIRALLEDAAGTLWVGTMNGLVAFDPATAAFDVYRHDDGTAALSNNTILSLHEDRTGTLWVGTDQGLNRLDRAGGQARFSQPLNRPDGPVFLGNTAVTVIHEDAAGVLYLGTWGGGLVRYDPARGDARVFGESDGLPDTLILGILEDSEGALWISTGGGLACFDPAAGTFRAYDRGDGLVDVDFAQGAYLRLPDGRLLFGSETGITAFDPSRLPANSRPPDVALTRFELFGRDVPPGEPPLARAIEYTDAITLDHNQSVFSIEFAALDFVDPAGNNYAYRLEGVDPDWIATRDRRFITYTNLNPGEYALRVRAANNDGVWNDEGVTLRLTVRPPWWATWWAYLLYVALAAALVGGVVTVRTRQLRTRFAYQQQLLEQERRLRVLLEQLDVIQEEDRRRIAWEMHDGLAQTLAALRLRSRVWRTLLQQQPERLTAEFDTLEQVLAESIQDVRRSIFALRPVVLDEAGLVPALAQLAEDVGRQYGMAIETRFDCPTGAIPHSLEHPLFRVAQELLNNAGKHARAERAELQLTCGDDRVRLLVHDNGVGFDTARPAATAGRGGLGLRQLRERLYVLGGELVVDSAPGAGARISVEVPLAGK